MWLDSAPPLKLEPRAHTFKTLSYREVSWMNKDPMEKKKKKKCPPIHASSIHGGVFVICNVAICLLLGCGFELCGDLEWMKSFLFYAVARSLVNN
jgi:hypothetical protein